MVTETSEGEKRGELLEASGVETLYNSLNSTSLS